MDKPSGLISYFYSRGDSDDHDVNRIPMATVQNGQGRTLPIPLTAHEAEVIEGVLKRCRDQK